MKCQNCGKHEATCHYSSNINGKITENHYCSQCAAASNWGEAMLLNTDSMFNNMFGNFESIFGTTRLTLSPWRFGFRVPALVIPYKATETEQKNEPVTSPAETTTADPEMQKRREINVLREQMRSAAESEDFEKAAQLRDKLHEMEK